MTSSRERAEVTKGVGASDELIRLATLAAYDVLDTEPEPGCDIIARLAARMFESECALVTLADGDHIWFKARVGVEKRQMLRAGTIWDHVVRSGQPLTLADAAADPRFRTDPSDGLPAIGFYAAAPLLTEQGVCLGALSVFDPRPRPALSDPAMAELSGLAGLVMQQLELRKARVQLRHVSQRSARLEALHAAIAGAPTCEVALTHLLTELCHAHGAAIGRIWKLLLPTEVMLEVSRYQDNKFGPLSYFDTKPRHPVTAHNSFTAASIRANQPTILRYADIEAPETYALVVAATESGLSCQVSYPIWVEGQYFGIALSFRSEVTPLAEIVADIASLEDVIRPALLRKVTEERLLLLGTALDRAVDGVLITEAGPGLGDAKVIYANAGFCQMTGYGLDEILGQTTLILRGPDTDRATLARIDQAMRDWRPIRTELLNYRKDGSPIWVELDLAPLANADGVITHWASSRRDITQRRAEATAMVKRERLRSLGQLTGGVSHDFNNLLTVITLNVEEALRRLPQGSPLERLLQPALHAAVRGAELTAQLLSYARRSPLQPRLWQLTDVFSGLQKLLGRSLGEQFDLQTRLRDDTICANVDGGQLENALTNLIINARDAMAQGGPIVLDASVISLDQSRLDHDDMRPGRYVRITVSDGGCGMTPEVLARVFDPFFTTKEVGQGSGLGLSMVYGFARQSGGTASLESTPGQGTVASLILPVGVEEQEGRRSRAGADTWNAQGRSVLVVEDQPEVLNTVLHLLTQLGFVVTGAVTADQALETLQDGARFDLLFTDIVLPGAINGLDLARLALGMERRMQILITSGFTRHSQPLTDMLDAGAELISKPYKRMELIDKLRTMLPNT